MEKIQEYWIEDSIKDKVFDDFYILGNELGKWVNKLHVPT